MKRTMRWLDEDFIRALIMRKRLDLKEVEKRAELTPGSLTKYLQGTMKISNFNAKKLADFLEINNPDILLLDDSEVSDLKKTRYKHRLFQQKKAHGMQKLVKELNSANNTTTNLFAGYRERINR